MVDYFAEPIGEMGKIYGCDFGQMVEMLRKQYDGYHFSKMMTGIYNPFSLICAFSKCDISDYWFRTGTSSYLIHLLNNTHEYLDELVGKYYPTSQFIDYKANEEMTKSSVASRLCWRTTTSNHARMRIML